MKLSFTHALVCSLLINSLTIFAAFSPPENGLSDLRGWPNIPVKIVGVLPSGTLGSKYEHTDGEDGLLKYTEQKAHKKKLFDQVCLNELRVGQSTLWAHKVEHPFCLGCNTYCINGKCGYTLEPSHYYFEQGLTTIQENNGGEDASDGATGLNALD